MGTRIRQVRIRANTDDALAAQTRGEAALRSLDLEPAAMPARMILCIRSMPDPMPGGVDLRSAHAARPTEWERAARGAVNDALHRAVRPARGIVPIDADAVLFADHAELLACAARDAGDGFLAAWWWPHLLRGTDVESVVFEWQRHPQHIAAAMDLLVQKGDAVAFVQKIAPRSATDLLMQVLSAHNLGHVASEAAHVLAAPPPAVATATPLPRQLALVKLVESTLTLEQRLFALVTLAIRRTPSLLRSPQTARALIHTIAQPQTVRPHIAVNSQNVEPPSDAATPRTPAEPRANTRQPRRSPQRESRTAPTRPSTPQATQPKAALQQPPVDEQPPAEAQEPQATTNQQPATAREAKHPDTTELSTTDTHAHTPTPQTPNAESRTPITLPDAIDTRHAGLFFLLNVATALGLYDPYDVEPPIDLNVWDFLALTGRALVPELVDDDLWPLLAALANRESDEELPDLDEDLLTRVREALHLVFGSVIPSVARDLGGRGATHMPAAPPSQVPRYARDDSQSGTPLGTPAAFVINQPGRITISPAHLDVTFCLAAHPLEIRVAGLDRDPGWIPAAGRHVDFHFD